MRTQGQGDAGWQREGECSRDQGLVELACGLGLRVVACGR